MILIAFVKTVFVETLTRYQSFCYDLNTPRNPECTLHKSYYIVKSGNRKLCITLHTFFMFSIKNTNNENVFTLTCYMKRLTKQLYENHYFYDKKWKCMQS